MTKNKHRLLLSYTYIAYICIHTHFRTLNHTKMTFGERLALVRKRKKLSQAEVGKLIGINGDAYGRYERSEVKPTIEMALKIAKALEVSLDFLTGNSDIELDKASLNRVQEITKLSENDQNHIFITLDALIRDFKKQTIIRIKLIKPLP